MKIWGDRCGKVDFIFSVFLPAFQRRCDQRRGHGLKNNVQLRSGPEYQEILTRQLFSFDLNNFLCECCFLISPTNTKRNKFILSKIYFPIVNKVLYRISSLPVFYQSWVLSKRACCTWNICFHNGLDHLTKSCKFPSIQLTPFHLWLTDGALVPVFLILRVMLRVQGRHQPWVKQNTLNIEWSSL